MTKLTTIDRNALKNLREPIEAALAELGASFGLKFKVGSGSYGGANGHFKLEIEIDDPAVQEAKEREIYNANCRWVGVDYANAETTGLRPEDFGTEFTQRNDRYRLVGIATGRSKYPVKCLALNGPKAGKVLLFGEAIAPAIRRATDAAKVAA